MEDRQQRIEAALRIGTSQLAIAVNGLLVAACGEVALELRFDERLEDRCHLGRL